MHWIDGAIITVYLTLMVSVGIIFRGRQKDANDYFTTDGGMAGLFSSILVGLSIAATFFSGISFLAYPSIVYTNGTAILLGIVVFPISWLLMRYWFLPRYFARKPAFPYDLIERRFGVAVRTAAAGMFSLLRVGWMAALIYAPTTALMAAADLGSEWFWPLVILIGMSSTIYTTLGGIRGVIITDAMQFIIILAGVGFTILYGFGHLPEATGAVFERLGEMGKITWPAVTIDPLVGFSVFSVTIGFLVSNMATRTADQMSLQRYLAVGDARTAARSLLINVVGVIIVIAMLNGIGLTLSAWYHYYPDPSLPVKADKVFPHFIATQLPVGIAGLLLAAILAATMSSMTSGINALAATLTVDIRQRLFGEMTARQQLWFGRIVSVVIGLAATTVAGLVRSLGTIFDITQKILGTFLGPLLACSILSVLPWRMHHPSIIVGMIGGSITAGLVAWSPISSLWTSTSALLTTLAIALAGRAIFGPSDKAAPHPQPQEPADVRE